MVAATSAGGHGGLLLVHAHPDDETVATGGTIAHYIAQGRRVTVVTCTRGDQGRVAVPDLQHLTADADDELGPYRAGELREALAALGVSDALYLVAEGRYRDSGRMGIPANDRPDAFWQADLDEAGGWLAALIRDRRPGVVVTYDPNGGYGHPDHIQAHRVTMRAIDMAGDGSAAVAGAPWRTPKVYWCAVPHDVIVADLVALAARNDLPAGMWVDTNPGEYPDGVHPDAAISAELDVSHVVDRKRAALMAHRTQLTVEGDYWVLASGRGMRIQPTEWFLRVRPEGSAVRENDLFAGLPELA